MESFKISLYRLVKKNIYILLIVVIGFIFLSPLLTTDFYITHDGQAQVVRIAAYYQAIIDGQIPPRWAGNLNYGYGLPTLNFFFPLEGYLGTLLHLIGFSFESSFKFLISSSFLLAPIFFYLWLREKFTDLLAFSGAIFYGFAPYHFLDIYVRGQLTELLAFLFIPLLFLIIEKNLKKQNIKLILLGGFIHALLVLSHSILSLVFTAIASLYILIRTFPKIKYFFQNFLIIIYGLLLSIYFWLPALYEGKYINSKIFVGDFYKDHFISLIDLFYSPWGFGASVNAIGGLSSQIGPFLIIFSILSLYCLSKKTVRKEYLFWLIIFLISVFLSTSCSKIIWDKFHILQQFQFPWRLTAISSFSAAMLSVYFFSCIKREKLLISMVILFIVFSFQYSSINKIISKDDHFYLSYPGTGAYHGEATTIWTAGDASDYPNAPMQIIQGEGKIELIGRKTGYHKFSIKAKDDVKVVDNTVYFPGWEARVDGRVVPIEFQDQNYRGLITFNVDKGNHLIDVSFKETKIRLLADIISLLSFSIIALFLLRKVLVK